MDVFLSYLISHLNDNVKYLLLTDFESDLQAKDIDLFIHPAYRMQFENTLLLLGWYKRKELTHHTNHHFYYSPNLNIYLDVKFSLTFANGSYQCSTYISLDQALNKAVRNSKGIYRPHGIDAIVLYAAHLAFKERGALEEKHRRYLSSYIGIYRNEIEADSLVVLEQIQQWLIHDFPGNLHKLRQIIYPHFRHEQQQMVRERSFIRYGYGLKVLFLGTDGAGKTTLINAVGEKLNLKSRKLYLGMGESGWTSQFSKSLYQHKLKVRYLSKLYNLFRTFVLLPSEFMLRIAPVKLKAKYTVVLIDRFPGSILLNMKSLKAVLYNSILPKPDIVFFLYADPEVLIQRKPNECTLERSKAEISKFRKVAHNVSNGKYIGVDTSNMTIDQARDFIISEIYKHAKVYSNLLITT